MKKELLLLLVIMLLLVPISTAGFLPSGDPTMTTPEEVDETPNIPVTEEPQTIKTKILQDSEKPTTNAWNETIIISPVWQQLIGTFFGLNLKGVSTKISVKETLILFAIFAMFLVLMLDILKLMPFFKSEFGPISGEFLAALIITILVSISGSFINLKDLFFKGVLYTVEKLDWSWVKFLTEHYVLGSIVFVVGIMVLHEFFTTFGQAMKNYSKVSRAEAQGRMLNESRKKFDTNA